MEIWDVYDIDRNKTGQTIQRGEKLPEGGFHLVVHICVIGSDGRMLIQQRQPFKKGFSNLWDVTAGGSAVKGENSRQAAHRELLEEVGLELDFEGVRPHFSVSFDVGFDDWYVVFADPDISALKLQYEEVQAVRWAAPEEILALIDRGKFVPYFKGYISTIFATSHHLGTIQEKQ